MPMASVPRRWGQLGGSRNTARVGGLGRERGHPRREDGEQDDEQDDDVAEREARVAAQHGEEERGRSRPAARRRGRAAGHRHGRAPLGPPAQARLKSWKRRLLEV